MASGGSDRDAKNALSKLLQMGTVAEYQNEFEILINRVTGISQTLLTLFYISGLKLKLQRELWRSRPVTLGEASSLARITKDYQWEFEKLMNRVTDIPVSLLMSRPTMLGDAFSLSRITETRFEAISEKEQNIKEKADTTLSLASKEASHVVKGPLDAIEDTILSLRSEDPNFKIQKKAVEYVKTLNAAPFKVVFIGPVNEVSSMIEYVFDIDDSNME
ncbi:hypothetical protein Tco_1248064, partial [Tanacetum coccineum]